MNVFAIDEGAAIGTLGKLDDTPAKRTPFAVTKEEPSGPWTIKKGRPLGSQLLIRKVEFKDAGLIMTPLTANRDTNEAEVIAVGPYVDQIIEGDTVLIRKYSGAGTEIEHEGQVYIIIDMSEVLLVMER